MPLLSGTPRGPRAYKVASDSKYKVTDDRGRRMDACMDAPTADNSLTRDTALWVGRLRSLLMTRAVVGAGPKC